jgi:outer membrane immunogenic protein
LKFLLGTTALCLAPAIVFAADLPMRTAAQPPIFVTAPTWAGFYFGGHLGYGLGSFDLNENLRRNVPLGDLDNNGVVAGVHAGYNYQSGMWVLGLEGDVSFAPWKETTSGGRGSTFEFRTRWMGSLRGRAGLAFNNLLIYATAGVGAVDRAAFESFKGRSLTTTDVYKIGAVAGAGFEYKLTQNIVVGLEGLYFFVNENKGKRGRPDNSSSTRFIGGKAGDVGVVRARLSFIW